MNAQLSLIQQVVTNDFDAMYQEQMLERRDFAYPPFVRLFVIYLKHRTASTVETLARETAIRLRKHFGTRVLGPDEPPVPRIQSLYIRRVIVKLENTIPLTQARHIFMQTRSELLAEHSYGSAHFYFDVDPL